MRESALKPALKPKVACTSRTSPMAPLRTSSVIFAVCGWQRYMNASIRSTLFARAASAMTMASA